MRSKTLFELAASRALSRSRLEAQRGISHKITIKGIQKLRSALGFDDLPSQLPITSSRQFMPNQLVRAGGHRGRILEITESRLVVAFRQDPGLALEASAELMVVRSGDASYRLRCPLIAMRRTGPRQWCVAFAHDDALVREQRRACRRFPVSDALWLTPASDRLSGKPREKTVATFIDVSAGGARIACPRCLAEKELLVGFSLGKTTFDEVKATVLSSMPDCSGQWHVQLRWDVSASDRARLVAVIAELARKQKSRA